MKHLYTHKNSVIFMCLGLFLALAAGLAKAGEPRVRVPSEAWVQGEKVTLGDIAVISGLDGLSKEIRNIYVGRAPSPGKRRSLKGSMIQAKLESLDLPQDTVLNIPARVQVHRLAQEVDDQDFEEMLTDFLFGKLPQGRFEISRFQVNGNGPVPEGFLDITLEEFRSDKFYGQVSLRAAISVDGRMERRVSIAAWVDYDAPIVVTTRNLDRMDILSAGDVKVETQNLSRLPEGVLTDPREIRGMRLRQDLEAGEHLLARMLEKPPLVERGEEVTIMARTGTMSITTVGLAKEAGGLGDSIEVENTMSEKIITCQVTGPARVEVRF